MKRIATIQDISCFGKCSLTVALPLISACGVEACPIPTAVLSTHTGGFEGFTIHDLTKEITPIADHWKKLDLHFDGIYTGYLGSPEQLKIVSDFIDNFKKENTIVFIDPVMGDHGKLYAGFDESFAKKMVSLVKKADIIAPNLTEVSYLLGIDYKEDFSDEEIKDMLLKLAAMGSETVIITGVRRGDSLGVMAYESKKNTFTEYFRERIHDTFHGTGDVFASVCSSALVKGFSVEEAIILATDFVVECIRHTAEDKQNHWYSVKFEECIPSLVKGMF
ncbi:MAG: pyridoxamine kinase [Clostridia bacterium]|nr:pyridoxamine kinase [Clostridia bacterium]